MVLVCGAECPKQRLGCAEWVMGIGGWGQTQSAGCGRAASHAWLMVKENGVLWPMKRRPKSEQR